MTTITALPPAPSRSDPVNFADEADAFVAALPAFGTEANALASEVNADAATATTQAGIATTQAGIATTQAGIATTQASSALASANAAAVSAANAETAWDNFDDRYLGAKTSNPTVDNDGNALQVGAMYWNSTVNELRFWNGTAWLTANLTGTGYLVTGDIGVTVQGYSTNLANFATKTVPSGVVVGTTDSQTLSNKVLISTQLTSPVISENVQLISTNTAAAVSRKYVATASLTLTLPVSPAAGDWVDFINRSGTLTCTVARNGQNIMSLAEDFTVDLLNFSARFTFVDATRGWTIG